MFDGTLIGESVLMNRNRNDKTHVSTDRNKVSDSSSTHYFYFLLIIIELSSFGGGAT